MEVERIAYRISVGNPEGMIPLRRPRRTWEGNIEMDLKGWVMWTQFIWLRIGTSGGLRKMLENILSNLATSGF
jgi:hypothetical protein